jgi:pSer/pThr/pTyr-binding forkhead associated (FHA) protein
MRRGTVTKLESPRFFIGRRPDCEIIVDDPYASLVHASVAMIDGVLYVRDECSTNGTYVYRRRVYGDEPLYENGYVHVGNTRLTYEDIVGRIRNRA